ncbi:MAG: Ser-Thr-rich GPI-anchored membrane family protein [Patescibacteria group bacterium]|nr:Ser-Thr-rich GPI-anchored membrane family protein [Patescibacteria group bacterium]
MKKNLVAVIVVLVIVAGLYVWYSRTNMNQNLPPSELPTVEAHYACDNGKTIDATFSKGEATPVEPGQPPVSAGNVKIVLSDGRNFTLPQTISADGSRYASSDESFVFWSKGDGALVLENNAEKSYLGCVVVAADPGGLPEVYHDGTVGFTVRYPAEYSLNTAYAYQGLGPGKDIHGVKFTIPTSTAAGTNLSSFDTGVSVEIIPATADCNAGLFLDREVNPQAVTDNGTDYSFASSTEGAAGNLYEEDVWALPGTNPCLAVRYLIHSTNIGNYPEGTITEFNRTGLIDQFDKIRQTLVYVTNPAPAAAETSAITVLTPNGGETWTKGEKVTITWSAPKDITSVNIRLAVSGNPDSQNFNAAIASGVPNTGSYSWTVKELYAEVLGVTDLPASDQYMVTVEDAAHNNAYDTSDATFSIK